MSGVGVGRWERGINHAPSTVRKERSADSALRMLDRRIASMETRYQKMMKVLREEGLDTRPFSRSDVALAFQVPVAKTGDYLLELKDLGLVRKMRAEDLPRMWCFVAWEGER